MKSSVRTISVLVVLFLVTGSFILAEDAPEKPDEEQIQKILEDMNRRAKEDPLYRESLKRLQELQRTRQKKVEDTLAAQEEHLRAVQDRLKKQDEHLRIERIQKLVLGTPAQYGAGRVLVIPTEEINPKQLLMITEDLNIMSRILDRKLDDADLGRDYDWFYGGNFLEWNIPVTKCIYLQEHGGRL
jgi:septal ring factor EnvC (AmiA/AmiB activator)